MFFWQYTSKDFPVNSYRCFIFSIFGMNMRLVMFCSYFVNDLQDKPEGLDVSVLSTDSVSGLPVALHPYG